jgi:hypothetical protein
MLRLYKLGVDMKGNRSILIALGILSMGVFSVDAAGLFRREKPAIPLRDVKVDLDKLKSWGTKKYALTAPAVEMQTIRGSIIKPEHGGYVTLVTQVMSDKVIISDFLMVGTEEFGEQIKSRIECEPNSRLTATKFITEEKRNDKKTIITADINGDEIVYRKEVLYKHDRTYSKTKPWNVDAVQEKALCRIVTLLPHIKRARYRICLAELEWLRGRYILTCEGVDWIKQGDKKIKCAKFVLQGEEKKRPHSVYWVDDDGLLQRVDAGDGFVQLDLVTDAEANGELEGSSS